MFLHLISVKSKHDLYNCYVHPIENRTTSFARIIKLTIFRPMESVRQVWAYPNDTCTTFFWKDDTVFHCQKGEVGGGGHLFLIMPGQETSNKKCCHLKCDNTVTGRNMMILRKKVLHPSSVLKMRETHSSITSASFYQTTVCTPDRTVLWIVTTIRTVLTPFVISTNRCIPTVPT
jgi:hypothetical protein